MSANTDFFVAWEEHIISQEKGNRIVHFFLKTASDDLVLAVVGTEKSIRHMIYVVADEYLQTFGSERFINASMKWRARREVVDWLTSMVSKHQPSADMSNLQISELAQDMGYPEHLMCGTVGLQTHLPDHMIQVPRRLKVQNSDIVWSGAAWICSKQLRHYPAFYRNGTMISVNSFVFIMAEEGHYVGYVEDLYEDKKCQKRVKVRWFHQYGELKDIIPELYPSPREVFITSHCQVISAECIDGPATVLTPKHYEKCLAIVSHSLSSSVFMCFRQFKNSKVKAFPLSKLHGYWDQAILTSLGSSLVSKHRAADHKSSEEDDLSHDDHVGRGVKRNRSYGNHRPETVHCVATNSILGNQITKSKPTYKKLRIKLSKTGTKSIMLIGTEPASRPSFKVGEKIELLCQDSGICGCWFRCQVLQASQKHLKVKYIDVEDADGCGYLEEHIPTSRVAAPDKLGMRCLGRLIVRPWPPEESLDCSMEIGAAVDTWWCDGWWEGVVTEVNISGNDRLRVYVPGDDRFLCVQRKHTRTSRDWVVNRWVDIKAKPDISAYISSLVNPKLLECGFECGQSTLLDCPIFTNKLNAVEEVQQNLSSLAISSDLMKQLSNQKEVDKVGENGDAAGVGAISVLDDEPDNQECKNRRDGRGTISF
ncbi:hypothetical protein NMG60_11009968 [Bertholletia excelsa]